MRKIIIKKNKRITPCPKCKNNTKFEAYSERSGEDCCDVWVKCTCGYDPTEERTGMRYETVWGGTSDENVTVALSCWNDAIQEVK